MIDAALRGQVERWILGDPHAGDRTELQALLDAGDAAAAADLAERWSGPLEFGTAGLRGPLRAGPRGMNLATVRRTTAGLAAWLVAAQRSKPGSTDVGGGTVVVGYDARRRSREFALDAAATLAAAGLGVRLADRPWPTPCTAYAVRWCRADAGVQVTASHNPAGDNGYKVYDATGAQIIPPDDGAIARAIDLQPDANAIPTTAVAPNLGDDLIDAYCAMALRVIARSSARTLRIVYTPLHGVGGTTMARLFAAAGFDDVHRVESQFAPDGAFPGLPFPNPEEPGVLDAAIALAREVGAAIVVANDPDADRLAICVDSPTHGWRMLSGDELGVALGDHLLDDASGARVVARSRVSSSGLDAVAAAHGAECVVTATGFKWLARAADDREGSLAFAYEEALGYAVSDQVRDKDGMTAALVAADAAARMPLLDRLAAIAHRDGCHVTTQWAPRFEGPDGHAAMAAAIERLGSAPADPIDVALPGGRALIRRSGTEPKLKCYFEVVLDLAEPTVEAYERVRRAGLSACERMRVDLARRLGLAS